VAAEQSAEQIAAQNIGSARAGYAAVGWGDPAAAMVNMADDVEWVVPGNSAVSGTYHGKKELGAFWRKFTEKSYTPVAELFLGDEERVMVLIHMTVAGKSSDRVDILTYRDGKVVKVQSVQDTLFLQQIFGTK
jgi:hypothetical protein